MRRPWLYGWLVALALTTAAGPVGAAEATPSGVITRFQGTLIEVMKQAQTLGVKGRSARLAKPMDETFHVPLMAGIAAGTHWKGATEAQRTRLTEAFRRMAVASLATMVTGYSGQTFELLGEKAGPQNTTIVDTRLVDPDGSMVNLAYVGRRFDGQWRFIDLIVDNGISELKTRQSEYARTLRDGGIDGLIALLDTKADELLAK